jgi:oxalate decarboxylase
VLDDHSRFSSFVVTAGQMFHVDSGALHHIENVGTDVAEFVIAFRNERPEDFGLGATFGAFTDAVLGNTYDLPASDMSKIQRTTADHKLAARVGYPDVPSTAYLNDPHKFDIEGQPAGLTYAYGNARFARDQFWPALKDISMYSLRVAENGMREPHWHPVTAETGYVHHGDARMTIMNPDGTLDSWNMTTGDVYFIPRAYPHHIQNIGTDERHFLIFFDQPFPADIGYRASASRLLARGARGDVQHPHRRPPAVSVHAGRSADREAAQSGRRARRRRVTRRVKPEPGWAPVRRACRA